MYVKSRRILKIKWKLSEKMKGAYVNLFCVRNRQKFVRFLNLVIMIDEGI